MSTRDTTALRDKLVAGFTTFWGATTPVAKPNEIFDPASLGVADAAAYVRPVMQGNKPRALVASSVSSRGVFEAGGAFGVEVYVRINSGTSLAYQLADKALEWFERQDVADVLFRNIGPLEEIGATLGGWYQVNAVADFVWWPNRDSL